MAASRDGAVEPEHVVSGLYEAASDPSLWPAALDRMGDALGNTAFVAGLHRPSGMAFGVSNRLDPERHALLFAQYVRPETNPLFAAMPRLPVLEPVPRQSIVGDDAYRSGGLYNDVFRPQGLTHVAVACLARENGVMISSGLLRRRGRPFTAEHARLYAALLPHLRRTIELTVRNLDLAAARAHAAAAANAGADALILVDPSGRVLFCNDLAGRILDAADGLACRGGRVAALHGPERQRLAGLIEAAALRRGLRGGSLRVARRQGASPWAVIVTPAPEDAGLGEGRPAALLRIVDLDARPRPAAERLAALFELSPAEARLAAALATGEAPDAVADRLGVRITTVRTQLRALFGKTGTSRQAELVALLARIAAPPR